MMLIMSIGLLGNVAILALLVLWHDSPGTALHSLIAWLGAPIGG